MKFNIKSAMDYSSKLKNATYEIEVSLRTNGSLVNRYGSSDEINDVPATDNGIYKATITHERSKISELAGKTFTDETIDVSASNDLAKLNPNIRLKLLSDLMKERTNIDYQIETIKNNSKIEDEFSGKEVTYDLGCQINKMYREYNTNVLKPLVEMNSELQTTINGKITVMTSQEDKTSSTFNYPIVIKAKSEVDQKDILKKYDDINNKCTLNSAKLSAVEISQFFDFEPKFNLNPSVRSLIEQYKEVK